MNKKQKILTIWSENAKNWVKVIDQQIISSRSLVTNKAIIQSILNYKPSKVLDLGCGEGWLTRTLNQKNIPTVGVDGIRELIQAARQRSNHSFRELTYQDIISGKSIAGAPFEAIVFNFSLFTENQVEELFGVLPRLLEGRKLLFIQTLHPHFLVKKGVAPKDQWLSNSWEGMEEHFGQSHAYFVRTMEGWRALFHRTHFNIIETKDPHFPNETEKASLLFVLRHEK